MIYGTHQSCSHCGESVHNSSGGCDMSWLMQFGRVRCGSQLLFDSGIGTTQPPSIEANDGIVAPNDACKVPRRQFCLSVTGLMCYVQELQHRALIFCQLKSFIDIIEKDLLVSLPSISFLRLDGTQFP
eukprot:COSAG01_NODE_1282_length_10921_cov_8.334319_5_plen_128_part_00